MWCQLASCGASRVEGEHRTQRWLTVAAISLLCVALSSCALVPDVGPAPQPIQVSELASNQSLAAPEANWPAQDWWTRFHDHQLNELMTEALAHSPSMAQAEARVREAIARTQMAHSTLYPTLDANASVTKQKLSYNYIFPKTAVPRGWNDMGEVTLDFSWELDFWGKNRDALRAATSDAQAAEADAAAARLLLTTTLADAYVQLQYLYHYRDITAETLRNRQASAHLIQRRASQGLNAQTDIEEAAARMDAAKAALAEANERIQLAKNGIAALLGRGPDRGLDIARPSLSSRRPIGVPAALDANLLGRIPEVVAARWRVEAAAKRVGVARAAFYPNVNLMAFIGFQSLGLDNLTRSGSDVGSVGPAISLPIFEGGRLRANYRGERAEYDFAVASYDQALTQALHETADALRSLMALADRLAATDSALAHSKESYRLAKARYQGGLVDYLTVLTAEDALLQARLADAAIHARGYSLDVALVKALGGGFESHSTIEARVKP
ncbi:efflux transporter outer membrane subunit [Salinicola salarius]|uniref:efflux transporter outer membrane subunit n=1 Tax=Salinicola salarius TaxID=430457 RepID=UPI000B3F72F2|nr:efflux transporter outer membrane subunit [Salinicola salarius]